MIRSTNSAGRSELRAGRIGLAGLVAAVIASLTVILFTVLPAGAGDGDPSALGVEPTEVQLGGQPNDCAAVASAATHELRIENPQNGRTYNGPANVSLTLAVTPDDEYMDYVLDGEAVVFDVVVKGGQKSTHFDYDATIVPGAVKADQALHAPTKGNGAKLFNISHVSFCYEEAFAVSGTVFLDDDFDGVRDAGDQGEADRVITAHGPSGSVSTASAGDGSYSFFLSAGDDYTVCEDVVAGFVQTGPLNTACTIIGTPAQHEDGGHELTDLSTETAGLDFGNAAEICGQTLVEDGVVLDGIFVLFDQGNNESLCENKVGVLFEDANNVLNLPLFGNGEVAGIGVITKTFGGPATFTPLTYSPTLGGSFEELPWCGLRPKGGNDGNEFDEYLDDPGTYPSLDGITDPESGDPSVSCKVFVSENASGTQVTVVLVQDDPYWQ